MNVAYDLRFASDHFVGIGTYAHAVLECLLPLPGDEHYLVLWDPRQPHERYDLEPIRSNPRVTWHELRCAPLDPRSVLEVGARLRTLRPDIYLSPFHLVPFQPNCPCIVTLHDVRPLRYPHDLPWWRQVIARLGIEQARRADRITTVSEFSRREILTCLGIAPDRVRTIHPGVQPGLRAGPSRRPAAAPEGEYLLVVGDNRPHKNLSMLAHALAIMEPFPWTIVTAGPIDRRYPSLAQLTVLEEGHRVVSLGHVSQAELSWLYRHATMLLFPSLYEGFGSPLVEALSFGVPVLAADIPALREVGGAAAIFLAPDQPSAWAEAMRRLASAPDERARLGDAGRARAAELTYDATARATLALLREAVA